MAAAPADLLALRKKTRRDPPAGRINYLSQEEVADEAGIDRPVYNGLEKGRLPLTQTYAERLAPVLGRKVYELVEEQRVRRESLEDRVAELERLLDELLPRLDQLAGQVEQLVKQGQPKRARASK
jgi:transcriptional regulator with XRE-family HTH domain